LKLGRRLGKEAVVVVNLSGRGDKDLEHAQSALERIGRVL